MGAGTNMDGVSLNMLTTMPGFLFFFQSEPPRAVHFPTSTAIDVARKVARDLGYAIDRDPNRFYFDVVTTETGNPLIAGYTAISFWNDVQPINHFEINERTGEIVDGDLCAVFDFPDLREFQRALQRATLARSSTTKQLAHEVGCDELTVVRKPVVPSTKSARPKN
jgi:hypothetical protein